MRSVLPFISIVIVVGVELVIALLLCATVYALVQLAVRLMPGLSAHPEWRRLAAVKARNVLIACVVALSTGIIVLNSFIVLRGLDPVGYTLGLIRSIAPTTWTAFGVGAATLAAATIGLHLVTRILRRLLHLTERTLNSWDHLKDNNQSVAVLMKGLDRAAVTLGWILVAVLASIVIRLPSPVTNSLLLVARIYLVIAVGLLVIRSTAVIVDTLNGLSRRYAQQRGWLQYYEHLRPLVPTFRACLEYALWIAVASLIMVQMAPMQRLAAWGPRLIQAIALFFAGRMLIGLGYLEIGHRMLPREGLDETERRRRATMLPLVRSAFTYAVYFGTAVLVLGALGFNPMPFLAGAGLLGLVVGFGAQSLINDVVSGFFILFENIYLVGDLIEVGPAKGVVEAIEFRTTKIRDAEGRVHVIRNGDMKPIINYSKDYTIAVVSMEVAYDADLPSVFAGLRDAGERLRADNSNVLEDTFVEGITAFGASSMTIRTSTRVRAGCQEAVAAELRLLIKETFDREAEVVPRKTLVGSARGA
ncbi:MAG TPA: mechanosensitive ion channel family protein [Vicinamibacterales bacterium]